MCVSRCTFCDLNCLPNARSLFRCLDCLVCTLAERLTAHPGSLPACTIATTHSRRRMNDFMVLDLNECLSWSSESGRLLIQNRDRWQGQQEVGGEREVDSSAHPCCSAVHRSNSVLPSWLLALPKRVVSLLRRIQAKETSTPVLGAFAS